jgi:hypothetical protein
MDRAARFKALPTHRKLAFYAGLAVIFGIMIAYISLIIVTLQKAFETASPWETVSIFLIVTLAIAVLARVGGLHEQ